MAGGSATKLRHPAPGLERLMGSQKRYLVTLERTAEEISSNGSDLEGSIRRLSRGNSIRSANGEVKVARAGMRVRSTSNRSDKSRRSSSGVNAIMRSNSNEVNGTSRWGGQSPNGLVVSPLGSPSESWSQPSLSRVQSGSRTSRLAQVSEPIQEGRPLDSPLRPSFSVHEDDQEDMQQSLERSRDASQSSFAQRYDDIAGQIAQSLEHVPPSPPMDPAHLHRQQALQHLDIGTTDLPPRPRSSDTYREAQIAFKDFDGVHFSPDTDEYVETDQMGNEVRRVSARSVSGGISLEAATMLRTAHDRPISFAPPPPDENMVFYPAPVPRMLNLPKRLSQLPSASVQAKRRSQVLGTIPSDARESAPWLAQDRNGQDGQARRGHNSAGSGSSEAAPRGFLNERMSANLNNLPPQLRANMYFEHQPVQHDIEVKSESAVATLDSILAASATAPVHAFTDHPFAGDVRSSVYSMERIARKSTATLAKPPSPEQQRVKKRRSSSIGALLKRVTSSDQLTDTLKKRGSRASMLSDFDESGSRLRRRQSQLSLGTQLEQEGDNVRTPASELRQSGLIAAAQNATDLDDDRQASRPPTAMSSGYQLDDADQIDDDFRDQEAEEDADEGDAMFVQPSTLLAELQVRKAQLKSRTKTAATAFPQGMHSTLLELDAVEAINQRKRQHQRIALAWEDPHQRALEQDVDKNDEDVPLGMLFPGKEGATARKMGDGRDFERPLGLMEKRVLEDNEPLANRRNRLRGWSPPRARMGNASQLDLGGEAEGGGEGEAEEEGGNAGETLGERMRRMRIKKELDGAIVDITGDETAGSRPISGLVDDVMSQFGGLDAKDKTAENDAAAGAPAPPDEDETLGQRRARLQREREASGEHSERPPIQSSNSLASLLASNPIGQRQASKNYEPAQGSLLHSNERLQARHKGQLQSTNMTSSAWGLDRPLVDSRQQAIYAPNTGGLLGQQHPSRAHAGGFGAGTYNNGMGGITPGVPQMNGFFASPTATAMNGYGYAQQNPAMLGGYNPYYQQQLAMQQQMQMQAQMQQQPVLPVQQQALAYPQHGMGGFSNGLMNGGGTYASLAQGQGVGMSAGVGVGGMGMNAGMPMGMDYEGLDAGQKAVIDRWRLSVAQQ